MVGLLSFYPTKNLGALGDAGAIVTNNKKTYDRLKMLRMYGEKKRYESQFISKHSRMDELQAAFLLTKMKNVNKWLSIRKKLAEIYMHGFSEINDLQLPSILTNREHTFNLFVILTQKRDHLKQWLSDNGIETGIHYPKPIHLIKPFLFTGKRGYFPQAEKWSKKGLSLPLHPFITSNQIKYVIKAVKQFFL